MKQNEKRRFWLGTGGAVPDAAPKITILFNDTVTPIVDAATMTQGDDNTQYYYDFTSPPGATPGEYQVIYEAIIGGVTERTHDDDFRIDIASLDDIKGDTVNILANIGASTGDNAIYFNVKDQGATNLQDVKIGVYNSDNQDASLKGTLKTDSDGNTGVINLDDADYSVRLSKAGAIISEVKLITVDASETKDLTVTSITITAPSSPELTTCFLSLYKLDGTLLTTGDATIVISKFSDLTRDDNGVYSSNDGITMTYDVGSETWQAEIWQDTHVNIISTKVFGVDDNGVQFNRNFTTGTGSTFDLGTAIMS